jgi:16S rRNA G527 N7-methylase RsmG
MPTAQPPYDFKTGRAVESLPGFKTSGAVGALLVSETSAISDAGLRLRDGFLDRIETFAAALALWGAKLNLTSAPDDPAEIAFHILDSLAPLAAASDAAIVLLEARRKRASFLSVTVAEMGLSNAQVNSSRTEALRLEPIFDVVTARAFAEPAIVFETARAALKPGGRVILYASPAQRAAIELASAGLFDPAVFLEYQVPRGTARVAHTLAIAKLIA